MKLNKSLLFSIILSACSGGYDNPESNDYVSPSLSSVTVQDADAPLRNDVVLGGTFQINITADEAILAPTVMINGLAADSIVGAGTSWTASKVMTEDDADGEISFNISFTDLNTNPGADVSATTDDSTIVYCATGCGTGGSTDGGTTDGGSTDGGSTDGGTTDGGSTDGGSAPAAAIEMVEAFGGALFADDVFTFPAGSEVWAGFANLNVDVYPLTFANGGTVTFTAAVPAGGADTSIYFRFEKLPHPDVEPSFNLDPVLISGAEQEYTVTVPAQDAANTYESFLMYVVDQDQAVTVKNIVVAHDGGTTGVPVEADYVEPTSEGIEIIKNGLIAGIWGVESFFGFLACGTCDEVTKTVVSDEQRGDVVQVSYSDNAGHAVLEILSTGDSVDVSAFTELSFDIKILNIGSDVGFNYLAKSSSSTQMPVDISVADSDFWQTITVPVSALNGVDLTGVTAPFIFFPDINKGAGLVYKIDDVRWQ